jgi:hypothetical protein
MRADTEHIGRGYKEALLQSYTASEISQIDRYYQLIVRDLGRLDSNLAIELTTACSLAADELHDLTLAKVLALGEVLRGVNKDERQPRSSERFIISGRLQQALRGAYSVGVHAAPFVLRDKRRLTLNPFRRNGSQLTQEAKEALIRSKLVHSASANRHKQLFLVSSKCARPLTK